MDIIIFGMDKLRLHCLYRLWFHETIYFLGINTMQLGYDKWEFYHFILILIILNHIWENIVVLEGLITLNSITWEDTNRNK